MQRWEHVQLRACQRQSRAVTQVSCRGGLGAAGGESIMATCPGDTPPHEEAAGNALQEMWLGCPSSTSPSQREAGLAQCNRTQQSSNTNVILGTCYLTANTSLQRIL